VILHKPIRAIRIGIAFYSIRTADTDSLVRICLWFSFARHLSGFSSPLEIPGYPGVPRSTRAVILRLRHQLAL
jgi:hypothetical protein